MTEKLEKDSLIIEKAKPGESVDIKTPESYKDFEFQLNLNGVDDIFDKSKINIKQDQKKCIFIIDGTPRFSVYQKDMEGWIQEFYNKKVEKNEAILITIDDTKEQLTIEYYKGELASLKEEIKEREEYREKSTDIKNIQYHIERNITSLNEEKEIAKKNQAPRSKYDRKDKGLWKIYEDQVQARLDSLEKIKKEVEFMLQNQDKKYSIERETKEGQREIKEVYMDDIKGQDMKETLKTYRDRLDELEKDMPNFIATKNDIVLGEGDTTPYYEVKLNSVKDATNRKLALYKIDSDFIIMNRMGLQGAKRQALQQDLKRFAKYLEDYEKEPNKEREPFVPKSGKDFDEFCRLDPQLKTFAKLNIRSGRPSKGIAKPKYEQGTNTNNENGNFIDGNRETNNQGNNYIPSDYVDAKEAFAKGGVSGVMGHFIDQTHMNPEQKQFRSGAGNIAMTAGMVYVGFRMIKGAWNLITGKNKGEAGKEARRADRAWLIAPTALVFGSQARTGQGPIGILKGGAASEKVAGLFGRNGNTENMNNNNSQEEQERQIKYGEGFPGITALFNGMTYEEMGQFLIQDGDTIKIDPDKYDELLDKLENGSNKNEAAADFIKSLGKDDNRHVIDLALTGMGITSVEQLTNNPTREFNKMASEPLTRLRSVWGFMDDNGYNKVNSETQYLIDKYISDGKPTLEDLEKRGDVFYKNLETQDKTGLQIRIQEISEGNLQREQDLLLAINTFWEQMPNGERNIQLEGNWPKIKFITYGQSSAINLESKTLTGFTPSRFDSYYELFKAANLTNYIQDLCKDKVSQEPEPFYKAIDGTITFNDAKLISTKFDTRVMTGGLGGELKNISPILETYKDYYIKYLNGLRDWKVVAPETEAEVVPYTGLDTQINAITTNPAIRAELSTGISLFYNYMPSGEKNIEISGSRPIIEFKTYWKTTKIDLSKKTIEGFSANKAFPTYFELFKAANLTNRIKYICKTKDPRNNTKPFDISTLGNIVFDDAKVLSKEFDTTIMTGGRFGGLKDVSPVLEENKESYVEYLNTVAPWKELDPMTFDPATKILKISNGEFKITVKELINGVWTEVDADITKDIDTYIRLIIQKWTTASIGTEATFDAYEHGRKRKVTVRRTK